MNKRTGGFTIVELIIAIVVIAILLSIIIVSYNWIRRDAYDAKVTATLTQLEKAFRLYVTKGNSVPLRHYVYDDFYATPSGGQTDHGVTVFGGGGIGRAMADKGYIPNTLVDSLKGGPSRDKALKNGIRFMTCGRKKVFFIIESYEGVQESTLKKKFKDLRCNNKNYQDWAAEHNIILDGYIWGDGNYRVQPNYKIVEIDIE